jgi:tRNA acetyltransferase TAN1
MDANLLVTYEPAHAGKAEEEAKSLLKTAGTEATFLESDVEGLFLVHTKKDPKEVVKHLVKECKNQPARFQYTFHWVPIEKWSSSDIEAMGHVMSEFDKKIDPSKKWKLDLEKRKYDKHRTIDLIIKLTDHINKPNVDLKNPDLIVKVEIIGDRAGLSLLKADELLNVPKMRAG